MPLPDCCGQMLKANELKLIPDEIEVMLIGKVKVLQDSVIPTFSDV